ncbi:MAG: nucleotidyl transferase AbiEii/AbiGii toxin family protein [Bryobacteraceae bacterium]
MLVRFASERFLFRLSQSRFREHFLLKGALLFAIWSPDHEMHRPTRDVDLLGFGEPDVEKMAGIVQEIAGLSFPDDGLQFEAGSVTAQSIREDNVHSGIRVRLTANLDKALIRLQVDVGFGDTVTPAAEFVELPRMLSDLPAAPLRAYPVYTVIAEKLEALVRLGAENSRLKDFFDLTVLLARFELDEEILCCAVARTFERRQTTIPTAEPIGLSDEFAVDKAAQWIAFLKRNRLDGVAPFDETIKSLRDRLMPLLKKIGRSDYRS